MHRLLKHPALVVATVAIITLFFAFQLPHAELDNNNFRFLPEKNQARLNSDYIEQEFGNAVSILVGLERPYGTVFEGDFLKKVRAFTVSMESVPLVKTVNSLMSAQYIYADGDSIVAKELVDGDFSGTEEEIGELESRIASWDMYQGALVSDDGTATQILIQLDVATEDAGKPEVAEALNKIREEAKINFDGLAKVYITGQPVMSAVITESIMDDLVVLIPLVVLAILGVLFFSFRRMTAVILPLLAVVISVVWSVGAMPLFGIRLTLISMLLPVIIFAVGSAYGIHVITHYLEALFDGEAHSCQDLVIGVLGKVLKPVFLASLTTFAGFLSFCFTPITPIREFGYFSCFGVLASFLMAVTLVPSLIILRDSKKREHTLAAREQDKKVLLARSKKKSGGGRSANEAMAAGLLTLASHRYVVLGVAVLVLGVAAIGFSKLVVDDVIVEYFKGDTDISTSDRFIRERFAGSKEVSLVVKAPTTEALLDPKVLKTVDNMGAYLKRTDPLVGKVIGFTDMIKRMNQVFNADEDPSGLGTPATSSPSDETSSFGFSAATDTSGQDASFGFGGESGSSTQESSFGFGDGTGSSSQAPAAPSISAVASSTAASASSTASSGPSKQDKPTLEELVGLLDHAVGRSPGLSGGELVRQLERLINYRGSAYYEIPSDPARYGKKTDAELERLMANYLVLLSGGDSGYSNDPLEPTAFKTTFQLRATGQKDSAAIVDRIKAYAEANLPKTVSYMLGGQAMLEGAITSLVVQSQIITIILSILMVFVIMAVSYKSLMAGVFGAVPVALAVCCNFAVMGFLGVKLNIGTALIASLTVGLGIDYTIHVIEFFKVEYRVDHRVGLEFLRRAFTSSGKAIIVNALSVAAGFGILAFSRFKILSDMGLLVALAMIITALISLTLIPALLLTVKPKFIYGE